MRVPSFSGLYTKEPVDISATVTDIVIRLPVSPLQPGKGETPCVHESLSGPEGIVPAEGANQVLSINGYRPGIGMAQVGGVFLLNLLLFSR